ncbi:MAG: SDR family oxidoreductase [Chloroflexi bacterium]|nr:SDR family oxidoreductase [Chloroflexota bacterium]
MRLKDKVAIITGAGSGLGRASAQLFSAEGAKVVVAASRAKDGEQTVRSIKERGGEAVFVQVDVTRAPDIENAVKIAVDKYGRLDIMFNNAGMPGTAKLIADLSEAEWQQVISVNLTGVFLGMKYAIPEMLKRGGGAIINTSSAAAVMPRRLGGAYATAKAAVIQLTRATALEYARKNIRVNCIMPGPIDTPFFDKIAGGDAARIAPFKEKVLKEVPIGRFATPEEIARVALFLASDDASYITGAAFAADGGQLLV